MVDDKHVLQSHESMSSGSVNYVLSKAKPLMGCTAKNKYSFICECFFMTTRVLNMGLMKALSDFKHIAQDGALLQRALSFYRLVVMWLVDLAGGFKIPLPSECPMEFACMPEHLIEDAMDLLIFTSRNPKALDGFVLGHDQSTLPIKTCLLENFRKKVVAIGRVNKDVPFNDEAYNIIIDEFFDGNEMFDRDGKFDDITIGEIINWPKYSVQFVRF